MAEKWESAAIQAIGDRWAAAKAAGASQDVLDAIHDEAERLRSAEGYSGGSDGSKYISKVTQAAQQVIQSAKPKEEEVIELVTDTGEKVESGFEIIQIGSSSGSSGDGTGQKILGYSVMFLVAVAVLDRILK